MNQQDKETIWLHFVMAYSAMQMGHLDEAISHSRQATDMLELFSARKKQSKMAVETVKFGDLRMRKAS